MISAEQLKKRVSRLEHMTSDRRRRAQQRIKVILHRLPRSVKELAMDGLAARARGEEMTDEQRRAWDKYEAEGWFEAVKEWLPYQDDIEKMRNDELYRRMAAGEDWRDIRLRT